MDDFFGRDAVGSQTGIVRTLDSYITSRQAISDQKLLLVHEGINTAASFDKIAEKKIMTP